MKFKKKILEEWNSKIPDSKSCLVSEFYDEIKIICPRDYAEEKNMKLALSVAIDMSLFDKPIDTFRVSEDDVFKVLYSTEADKQFKEYSITIDKDGIKNDQAVVIIDYKKVQPIQNTVCGVEFRNIALPIFFSEVNPYCCAKIVTDKNNFICTQQQSKCYIQLRQMILKYRKACLETQGVQVSATGKKIQANLEIVFADIDNFKYRGEVTSHTGTLVLGKESVAFKKKTGEELYKFNYETLSFKCEKTHQPCTVKEFTENQDPFMNPDSDKVWFQSAIRNFFSKNSNIKEEDCMVVLSLDTKYDVFSIVLACTTTPNHGDLVRESLADFYKERIKSLTDESKELKNSPSALKNEEYDVKMIIKDSSLKAEDAEPSKSVIKVAVDGIIMKNSGDYLFKFDNLINYKKQKVNFKFKVNKSEINADKYKINENCCLSAQTQSNKYIICLDSEKRCYYNKLIMYRLFDRKTEKKLKFEIARKSRMSQLYSQAEDPFDFGIKPKYKEFDSELNKLSIDTLDISTNGIWHGWVFYSQLTKRNYQHKVSPVWLEIEEGKILIKTDFNNVYPYKSLDLKEYDQICSGHCQPSEYIEKQFKNGEDYEDTVFLKKTIENVTAQLLVPFDEEACTILDFVNPVWGHGHSHIICAVDKLQGSQIRESINISYYDILLNLDIDTQVKMPYLETDQYDGVILINGEINSQYNKFYIDKEGLVGKSVSTEDGEDQKDVQPYKVLYKDISGDNFGTECAFWYKNLRIKQRSDDINNAISDNNCCFRFFAGQEKKKIEICTFLKGGGICIKESRQLMKGIRSQCLNYVKNLAKVGQDNEEVETMIDIYTEKTVDDSENGNFEGFVNIGSATKASQNLRQVPFFIKITKNEINLYNDYTNTKKADVTIMTDNILFSCKDSTPCKPSSYRSYVTTTTKNSILIDSIRTTYGLFKDTYGLNDESFENNCFVLEDGKSPYLVCSSNPSIVPSLKKSIIQAFNLNYSCKQISAPAAVEANAQYSVKIFREKNVISDKLELDAKGINMVTRKTHLFTYDKIDKDSVTGSKCAVWFKELPITVDFPNPQCCFAISAKKMIYTICVEDGDMCISSAYKVIKTVWNRCMGQDGDFFVLPQSVDPEVLGQTNKWSPKIPFIPGKGKFDICPNSREVQIFDENKNLIQEFSIDNYNDIAFSEAKTLFKGWFKVYPLHNVLPNNSFLKLYGELSAENFVFYPSDTEKSTIKMSIRPDLLSMSCGFTEACKPFDFLDKVDEYGVEIQKEKYRSIIKTIEYGDDEGCAVLQRMEKATPEFYVICVHIRKHKTTIKPLKELLAATNGYAATRNVISSFYGAILRKITYQSYVIARKFLDPNKFPNHEGPFRQLKYTKQEEKVEVRDVKVDKVGAAANGAYILKYNDFKNCNIKVNIIYTPKDLIYKDKQQCCLRYRSNTRREYICLFDMNCEAETLRFAHLLKTNCQKFVGKPGNIFNDLNSLPVVRIMPIIKTVFQATLSLSNPMELNPIVQNDTENPSKSKPISTQAFITKNKTLAIKYLYMIKKIIHGINLSQPYDSGDYPESADNKDMYKPEFYGKNLEGELKLTVADQKRIYAGPDGLQLTILGDAYYIKHKEFQAVINPKISYSILKYKKDNVMKLLFIFDKKLMLATKSESAPKHVFLKEINDNIKETGLVLDSDDFKKIEKAGKSQNSEDIVSDKENPQKAIDNKEAAIPNYAL